jgi:hypothetical protein
MDDLDGARNHAPAAFYRLLRVRAIAEVPSPVIYEKATVIGHHVRGFHH